MAVLKEYQHSSEPEPSARNTNDEEEEQKQPERDNKGTKGEGLLSSLCCMQADVFLLCLQRNL